MEEFISKITSQYQLDNKTVELLIDSFQELYLQKDQEVISIGETDDALYFILEGVMRTYVLKDGEEMTLWFSVSGDCELSPWCIMRGKPSRYTVSASCKSRVLKLDKKDADRLCETSLPFMSFIRDLYAMMVLRTDEILLSLSSPNATDRYLSFMDKLPEVLLSVPQKDIARFLGITPQSLSRIRRSISAR